MIEFVEQRVPGGEVQDVSPWPTGSPIDVTTDDRTIAVRRWFTDHAGDVHAYAARRVGADLADDVLAETFRRAFESFESFDPDRGAARTWLFGIAGNVLFKHRRSEARRFAALERHAGCAVTPVDPTLARLDALGASGDLGGVMAAVERLAETDRELLILVVWEKMPSAEVGEILGIPAGTVRSRLKRIRTTLDAARHGQNGGDQ